MAKLTYPDLEIPTPGALTAIGPGVFWLRMPLPFDLNHINLYLLEDGDGWYLVDTGLGDPATRQHWETVFERHLGGKPVKGIIVTHMHPDHIGQAGDLSRRWRAPLWITRTEYLSARALSGAVAETSSNTTPTGDWQVQQHYQRSGISAALQQQALRGERGYSRLLTPVPRAYQRLQHQQVLTINGLQWRVLVGRGHSPEHACLFCESLGMLISGDQILPSITPNISVYSTEPEANALADYLDSLPPFMQLPAATLVLPAHNRPFYGLHTRVRQLEDHHQQKLTALLNTCREPRTAAELLPIMFKRELNPLQTMFALGECLSHLNYLLAHKELTRTLGGDQVYRYQTTQAGKLCAELTDTGTTGESDTDEDQPFQV